jgi:hypothetical protein
MRFDRLAALFVLVAAALCFLIVGCERQSHRLVITPIAEIRNEWGPKPARCPCGPACQCEPGQCQAGACPVETAECPNCNPDH